MRGLITRLLLAITLVMGASAATVVQETQSAEPVAAQSQPYVAWAAYYGCDTNNIHYRLTEHGMFVNGVPYEKRFYIDILIGNTIVHQNAYHAAVDYNVFAAGVRHIVYPGHHISDQNNPGTDTHHCRFVFGRWTHNTSVHQISANCGTICYGFRGTDSGYFLVSNNPNGSWNDWSDWIIPTDQCLFSQDTCNGGNDFWYDRCNCTWANGSYQHAGDLYVEHFVDGY